MSSCLLYARRLLLQLENETTTFLCQLCSCYRTSNMRLRATMSFPSTIRSRRSSLTCMNSNTSHLLKLHIATPPNSKLTILLSLTFTFSREIHCRCLLKGMILYISKITGNPNGMIHVMYASSRLNQLVYLNEWLILTIPTYSIQLPRRERISVH